VSIGAVIAPGHLQPKVFREVSKSLERQLRAFSFFGEAISSKYRWPAIGRGGGPQAPQRKSSKPCGVGDHEGQKESGSRTDVSAWSLSLLAP